METITITINGEVIRVVKVLTLEDARIVVYALKELSVKLWLIEQGRFDDLYHYTLTGNHQIEQEAVEALHLTITQEEEKDNHED